MSTRLIRLIALICVFTMFSPAVAGASSYTATKTTVLPVSNFAKCSPNDEEDLAASNPKACLNGSYFGTRGYISKQCFSDVSEYKIYTNTTCSNGKKYQIERIAQARFIQSLDTSPGSIDRIAPGIQWEVRKPKRFSFIPDHAGLRMDVIRYDYTNNDPYSNPVSVWELKGTWNSDVVGGTNFDKVRQQLDKYIAVGKESWPYVQKGEKFYTDSFQVQKGVCPKPNQHIKILASYAVYDQEPGIIAIKETGYTKCPGQSDQEYEKDHAAYVEEVKKAESPSLVKETDLVTTSQILVKVAGVLYRIAKKAIPWQICYALNEATRSRYASVSELGTVCMFANTTQDFFTDAYVLAAMEQDPALLPYLADFLETPVTQVYSEGSQPLATISGDPHIKTLDGLDYSLDVVGEFTLLETALPVGPDDFTLQGRFEAINENASKLTAISMPFFGNTLEFQDNGKMLINGKENPLSTGQMIGTPIFAGIVKESTKYTVTLPVEGSSAEFIAITWDNGVLGVSLPTGSQVVGLLGDNDGSTKDELTYGNYTPLPANPSAELLHGSFADSWRLTQELSYFTYPAGKTTDSYTNKSFPKKVVKLADFSQADQDQAGYVCQIFGVTEQPNAQNCQLDLLKTKDWSFAGMAADLVPPTVSNTKSAIKNSELTVDFEQLLPQNFASKRLSYDPKLSKFAGPLVSNEKYNFSLDDLPAHSKITLTFDLITISSAGKPLTTPKPSLKLDGQSVVATLDTQKQTSGILSTGVTYSKVPATITQAHSGGKLSLSELTLTGLDKQTAFAIDNIKVKLQNDATTVPKNQTFRLKVGSTHQNLTNHRPESGAGYLETSTSIDNYIFATTKANTRIVFDFVKPVQNTSGTWRLVNSSNVVVGKGKMRTNPTFNKILPKDTYRLIISSEEGKTGSYYIRFYEAPQPKNFKLKVTKTPISITKSTPSSGAGTLATRISKNNYSFSAQQNEILLVDLQNVSTNLIWELRNPAGKIIKTDTFQKDTRIRLTAAGNYTLTTRLNTANAYNFNGKYDILLSKS